MSIIFYYRYQIKCVTWLLKKLQTRVLPVVTKVKDESQHLNIAQSSVSKIAKAKMF